MVPTPNVRDFLGPLETIIMEQLWYLGPKTAVEMTSFVNAKRSTSLSSKTILTCLTRLEAKGFVGHVQEGRAFRFAPTAGHEQLVWIHLHKQVSKIIECHRGQALIAFLSCVNEDQELLSLLWNLLEAENEGSCP